MILVDRRDISITGESSEILRISLLSLRDTIDITEEYFRPLDITGKSGRFSRHRCVMLKTL
jgi:hypothetical protein